MGGRGAKSGGGLAGGSGVGVNITSETDVWSYRHNPNNEAYVDAINSGVRSVQEDFPDMMDTVQHVNTATLAGADATGVLGFYNYGDKTVALNSNYTNVDKMNRVYDDSVAAGFHPSRGNKTGTEAVAIHEMGHALTDHLARKNGMRDLDELSEKVVDRAYKATGGRGKATKKWAGRISGYAQSNYAETVAEAVADFYCNGSKASAESKAIMAELKKLA